MTGGTRRTPTQIIHGRRRARAERLAIVGDWADGIDEALGVRAVVVVGSVARGDWHDDSDIDVLVVADELPPHPLDRLGTLPELPRTVEPVVWTPSEFADRLRRGEPLTAEAREAGVWLRGSLDAVTDAEGGPPAPTPPGEPRDR